MPKISWYDLHCLQCRCTVEGPSFDARQLAVEGIPGPIGIDAKYNDVIDIRTVLSIVHTPWDTIMTCRHGMVVPTETPNVKTPRSGNMEYSDSGR